LTLIISRGRKEGKEGEIVLKQQLGLEEAVRLHKELWDWKAHNPGKHSREWPRWKEIQAKYGNITSYCFACDYDVLFGNCDCGSCFLDWGIDRAGYARECFSLHTVYSVYIRLNDRLNGEEEVNLFKTQLAIKIRDLRRKF
jgi:hypothetical protein